MMSYIKGATWVANLVGLNDRVQKFQYCNCIMAKLRLRFNTNYDFVD